MVATRYGLLSLFVLVLGLRTAAAQPLVFDPAIDEGIEAMLEAGATGSATLTMTNLTGSDVSFDLPQLTGTGGYIWIDSDAPGGPALEDVDIRETGTPVVLKPTLRCVYPPAAGGDARVDLPFPFPFYGELHDTLWISANGFVAFQPLEWCHRVNRVLPHPSAPTSQTPGAMIAPIWAALNGRDEGTIYTELLPDGRFVIQWTDWALQQGQLNTFQLFLQPSGVIKIQLLQIDGTFMFESSGRVGMQNHDGSQGHTFGSGPGYVHAGRVVLIFPEPPFVSGAVPATGTVPAGGSVDLQIDLAAGGLFDGAHLGLLHIDAGDAGQYHYPLTLNVSGDPDCQIAPDPVAFGVRPVGFAAARAMRVENHGTRRCLLDAASADHPAYSTDFAGPAVIWPARQASFFVTFAPTEPGSANGTLTLTGPDGDVTAALLGAGRMPPAFDPGFDEGLEVTTPVGSTASGSFTITNPHDASLGFSFPHFDPNARVLANPANPLAGMEHLFVATQDDTDPGHPLWLPERGEGGPDAFGYTWIDSDEPFGPAFEPIDIRDTGTTHTFVSAPGCSIGANYEGVVKIDLPFAFSFYGEVHTQAWISVNGLLTFQAINGCTGWPGPLPSPEAPNPTSPGAMIAPIWTDFQRSPHQPAEIGTIQTQQLTDGRLVIQWTDWPAREQIDTFNTVQLILSPSGTIKFQYLDIKATFWSTARVGMQDHAGTDGLLIASGDGYPQTGKAVVISGPPPFVSGLEPAAGSIPPGGTVTVDAAFDTTQLLGGVYGGALRFETDEEHGLYHYPVTLDVAGDHGCAITPDPVAFGGVLTGEDAAIEVVVSNDGTGACELLSAGVDHDDFSSTFAGPVILLPGHSTSFDVVFAPSSVADLSATLMLSSDVGPVTAALQGRGLAVPSFDPDLEGGIVAAIDVDGTSSATFSITNHSHVALDFVLPQYTGTRASLNDDVLVAAAVGGADRDLGGPDDHGYYWIDSDEPFGPAFEPIDIRETGATVSLFPVETCWHTAENHGFGPVALPFSFPYYGQEHNLIFVGVNGFITMHTVKGCSGDYRPLPGPTAPTHFTPGAMIAPLWTDLWAGGSASIRTQQLSDGRFVIQWTDVTVAHMQQPGNTFQAILSADGTIKFQYLEIQGTFLPTVAVGMQNYTGTDGFLIAQGQEFLQEGKAVLIGTQSSFVPFAEPASGTIAPGATTEITIGLDAANLLAGSYSALLHVVAEEHGEYYYPVTIEVMGEGDCSVAPVALDFGVVLTGSEANLEVQVANAGTGPCLITEASTDHVAFIAHFEGDLVVAPGASETLSVMFAPDTAGEVTGTLTLASPDGDLTVALSGVGRATPSFDPPLAEGLLVTAMTGHATDGTIVVTNDDLEELHFIFPHQADRAREYANPANPLAGVEHDTGREVPRGEDPGLPTHNPDRGEGGPDAYGYSWIDSNEPGGPAFEPLDIANSGSVAPLQSASDCSFGSEDEGFAAVELPFSFPFYGQQNTSVWVSANGFLAFQPIVGCSFTIRPIPGASAPTPQSPGAMIAPLWADLHAYATGQILTELLPDGRFVIQWDQFQRFGQAGSSDITMQVILYPGGAVKLQYLTVDGVFTSSTRVGQQRHDGTDGLLIAAGAGFAEAGKAVLIASDPPFVTGVSPAAGTIAPGASQEIVISADADGFGAGTYHGSLRMDTGEHGTYSYPITFQVEPPDHCTAGPDPLVFDGTIVGAGETLHVTVVNETVDACTIMAAAADDEHFEIDFAGPVTLEPGTSVEIGVTFTPSSVATVSATLTVETGEDPIHVGLTGIALFPPVADVQPASLEFTVVTGHSVSGTLTLSNLAEAGAAALEFTVSVAQSRAQGAPSNGQERPLVAATGGGFRGGGGAIDCDFEPGIIIQDDGSPDSGYGGHPAITDATTIVDKFTPAQYPATFTDICLAFTSSSSAGGPVTRPFEVVFYAGDGPDGAPGTRLATVDAIAREVPTVPPYNQLMWQSFDLRAANVVIHSGSIFIGARWVAQSPQIYLLVDHSDDRPPGYAGGYYGNEAGGNPVQWSKMGTTSAPSYRATFIRPVTTLAEPHLVAVAPASGAVPAGDSAELTVTIDANGVAPGTHEYDILIATNEPEAPLLTVPVTITVEEQDPPQAAVEPAELHFELDPDETADAVVTLSNLASAGAMVLDFSVEVVHASGGGEAATPSHRDEAASTLTGHLDAGSRAPLRSAVALAGIGALDLADAQARPVSSRVAGAAYAGGRGGLDCNDAPGIIIQDDGTPENAYGANPSAVDFVTMVDRFTPAAYPATITDLCVAFVRASGGSASWPFEVMFFADDGPDGEPGTLLGSVGATAHDIPEAPPLTLLWQTVDVSLAGVVIESGSVFIGVRWEPASPNLFIVADQSADRPVGYAGGYFGVESGGGSVQWSALGHVVFNSYRALFIRPVAVLPAPPPVVAVMPDFGSVPAGGAEDLTVTVSTQGSSPGVYEFELLVTTNDPENPLLTVAVTVSVSAPPPPLADVQPLSLEFALSPSDLPSAWQVVTLSNLGIGGAADLEFALSLQLGDGGAELATPEPPVPGGHELLAPTDGPASVAGDGASFARRVSPAYAGHFPLHPAASTQATGGTIDNGMVKAEPASGSLAPGESLEIMVTAYCDEDDDFGSYTFEMHIQTNDPDTPVIVVQIEVVVAETVGGEEGGMPLAFALEQNHPNPFADRTTITYAIPEPSHALLEVFDLSGRRVSTLVDDEVAAGRHVATWDAATLASGVYLIRFQAGTFSRTLRAVVVR